MVSKSLVKKVLGIAVRIILLCAVISLGILTSTPARDFAVQTLGYQKPPGFFGYSFGDWEVGLMISIIFWGGIIFGAFGKKVDYIFFFILSFFVLLDFLYSYNITPQIYLGLIGVALLGNALGYMLKVGRQNYFGK